MQILTLFEAADFVKVAPNTLRALAKAEKIPCNKIGREWRFVDTDLIAYVSGKYNQPRQDTQVATGETLWQQKDSTNVEKSGGSITRAQTENEYLSRLGLGTKRKPKNSGTN